MRILLFILYFFLLLQCSNVYGQVNTDSVIRIAFGSCLNQSNEQLIWHKVAEKHPGLFIFLGDNVYGDTKNMKKLRKAYTMLHDKPGLKMLKETAQVLAVWDDHDYGKNNATRGFIRKQASKKVFLDFFDPDNAERRSRPGIYTSFMFGDENKLQVILLDTRWFRQRFIRSPSREKCMGPYGKMRNERRTFLGRKQWKWLEQELAKKATIRIICTSTQFLADFNGHEAWLNMPHEQERMMKLIESLNAKGVIFISGDAHYAELSKLKRESGYTFFDLTSSGMTHGSDCVGPNRNRVDDAFPHPNFGLLTIDFDLKDIRMEIIDDKGNTVINHKLLFSELAP